MTRSPLLLLVLPLALAPALVGAHPPAADFSFSCAQAKATPGVPVPGGLHVGGVVSVLAPAGSSLPCTQGLDEAEWSSHATSCQPFIGPIHGAYCGPTVPPLGTATCSWSAGEGNLPVGLVIGFDAARVDPDAPLPVFDGNVRLTDGERPVFGPFPPGAWTVTNPYPASPARVIAYPTNAALPPHPKAGLVNGAATNTVVCVVP